MLKDHEHGRWHGLRLGPSPYLPSEEAKCASASPWSAARRVRLATQAREAPGKGT